MGSIQIAVLVLVVQVTLLLVGLAALWIIPPDSRLGLTSLLAAAPYFGLASTRICTFTSSSTHSTDLAVGTGI